MKPDYHRLSILVPSSLFLALATASAGAASWQAGDWKLGLGGNINQFYMSTSCGDSAVNTGAAPGTITGYTCASADDKTSIQNGLLPASLNASAATSQDGWDISANINVYYGTVSSANGSGADALAFSTVDARQVFMTFGKPDVGTFKFGRDFGLFAFDVIINDMTLLGSGAAFAASEPGHTTLGGLGYGYAYTDRLSQINYTTPDFSGFTATVGLFQPFSGNGATAGEDAGMHGKLTYAWGGDVSGKVSVSFLTQEVNNTASGSTSDIQGFDLFAMVSMGELSVAGYFGDAEGMTTLAIGGLLFPGFDASGAEETSWTMLQATYKVMPQLKLGINVSSSEQTKITEVDNTKTTVGAYYNLTQSLTLVGEYSTQESELANAGTDESSNINLGAILFF